jgi:two-component system KDP operon response regulator KdpE
MMTHQTILLIDDEPQLRKLVRMNLQTANYKVIEAEFGEMGLQLAKNINPDLILLDLDLPDINGIEVLKSLKTWYEKPVIILSVLDTEQLIINALDLGANDYLTKPFRTGELLARIRSNMKKRLLVEHNEYFISGKLSIDFTNHLVSINNEIIKLTVTEFKLLSLLAKNQGRVLTHHFLLKEIWGVGHQTDTPYLRVNIGNIRKKIEINPNQPEHIITESGIGYRFQ